MLPPVFGYWREFGARYVTAMCGQQDQDTRVLDAELAALFDESRVDGGDDVLGTAALHRTTAFR
jgi:hypothetical protein